MHATPALTNTFTLTYRHEWQDGYGARGWKLDIAMPDDEVIACTAYTGAKTPTSVLVHDLLDHVVAGFRLSGYVNEARATAIHGLRNGIEIQSSFAWMADEILNGATLGSNKLGDFLPAGFDTLKNLADSERIHALVACYGRAEVRAQLIGGFFRIGIGGVPLAVQSWSQRGLRFDYMNAIGLCLQRLLERAESWIMSRTVLGAKASILIDNDTCRFDIVAEGVATTECLSEKVDTVILPDSQRPSI